MIERDYLRELAKSYLELAHLPIMEARENQWYAHNALKGEIPMIVVEMATFEDDLLPKSNCESKYGKAMEKYFNSAITNFEKINDDKVVSPYFEIPASINIKLFDLEEQREYAVDSTGKKLGFKDEHFIVDLVKDFPKLKHSTVTVNSEETNSYINFAQDIIGDLMPIVQKNKSLEWTCGISQRIIELMGMEALMYAILDCPNVVKELYDFVCEDIINIYRIMEKNNALTANNKNDYAGAGSYGFTKELNPQGNITSKMLWGNMNSQETTVISPEMYEEFVFPSYLKLSREFGLTYYGCCEAVDSIWNNCVSKLNNLRKVSVSAWCNEEFMGEALRGGKVIYSRKPSPNFIGVGKEFDEEGYKKHISYTLNQARGCTLEIIHRDIYTLNGNLEKPKKAVQIIRELIDKQW